MEKAPDAFRTISEVADDLDIPQHVLRFWESRFTQIKPMKRGGGRRYYRPDDVDLLRGIRHLLYGQGYTIRGVQRILRERGARFVQTVWEEDAEQPVPSDEDRAVAEEVGEDEEEAGTAQGLLPRLRRPEPEDEPERPVPAPARREPTFAAPSGGATPARAAAAARSLEALNPPERATLRAALAELTECRRLLDAALEEAS